MIDKLKLNGKGIFISDNCQIESIFTVQRQLSHTIFLVQGDYTSKPFYHHFDNSDLWSLDGQLDDGRPILANKLMLSSVDVKGFAELLPLDAIIIGQSMQSPVLEVRYPLVGMFDGKFLLEDSGWTIEVLESDQNAYLSERRSKAWRLPCEGLTLRLTNAQATLDEYHKKGREIMLLLSLAAGNGVTSYRKIVDWGVQGVLEVWRQMTGDEIGPGPIVPAFRRKQFLKQALPIWRQWKSEKRSEARLAITYINLSATGYLDTRIFQISQAWEFLASSWVPKGKLNDLEKDLRSRVKSSYRKWKREHPEADPKGNWGNRIMFPFRWPLVKKQIHCLAKRSGINLSKIGINFESLKVDRDSVAHTGKLTNQMTSNRNDNYKLLTAAQFGLQLLLLSELNYSGLVITASEGFKSFVPINKFQLNL